MYETKKPRNPSTSPGRRGAATPSKDGVARISIHLQPRLSATELIRVLLATPEAGALNTLSGVKIRTLIANTLTQYGYEVLARSTYDPCLDHHQDARHAIRRAYGHRFSEAPDEQTVLADPLWRVLGPKGDEP
ncbi:DUF6181 family protein [Streptomyces sp. NPDC008317]|uniref:DUF6181 family protein n=1 Tax=Streptomyces sp. NPDC008317 TaxID=3364827 RepID=UPI0036EEC314